MKCLHATLLASTVLLPVAAMAQEGTPRLLERQARVRELEQLELDSRLRINRESPLVDRALLDFGGYATFNYLSVDDSQQDNHVLRQYDLVGYGRAQFDGAHEIFVRGRTGYRDFNDGDSFDGLGDEVVDGDLDRAYYKFDLAKANVAYKGQNTDVNVVFKGGRDLAYWANGLVMAQVLDGISLKIGNPSLELELLAGVTPTRTVDFDPSRPAFDHNTRRGFYGAMVSTEIGSHQPFAYGLVQRDYNTYYDTLTTGAVTTDFDYNSYYVGIGSTGSLSDRLLYGVEFAYEFGDTLSNSFIISQGGLVPIDQTRDDIQAYAIDGRLDYILQDRRQSRLGAELILASGDSDRGSTSSTFNGNTSGSKDKAFNAFGLLNTGLAFAPAVSNLAAVRIGASTFPFNDISSMRRLQIGTDVFFFGKFDSRGPIDEATDNEQYLGFEPDIYLNWQLASDITFVLRYGIFFPDSSAFPSDEPRQFIYAGVTFAF